LRLDFTYVREYGVILNIKKPLMWCDSLTLHAPVKDRSDDMKNSF